ncbi:hypothetical protein ACWGBX_38590, partial [Streptomyces sp. NPDC055037]
GVLQDLRAAIKTVGDIDPATEDLLIEQLRDLKKFQWFVRAHLETAGGTPVGAPGRAGRASVRHRVRADKAYASRKKRGFSGGRPPKFDPVNYRARHAVEYGTRSSTASTASRGIVPW